jgi:RNA polymerase sigma-70 factor (ECF subfamily)
MSALSASATGEKSLPPALLRAALRGDESSLGRLLQTYRNYLVVLATTHMDGRLGARISPSDVVQETLLEAHRGFQVFRGTTEREFIAWLRQILMNNLLSAVKCHLGAQKRDVRREISINNAADSVERAQRESLLVHRGPSPSDAAQRRENAVMLADLLTELSDEHRRVIVLRHLEGLGFNEIAERMDRSAPATRILWLRAVEKLRTLMKVRQQ